MHPFSRMKPRRVTIPSSVLPPSPKMVSERRAATSYSVITRRSLGAPRVRHFAVTTRVWAHSSAAIGFQSTFWAHLLTSSPTPATVCRLGSPRRSHRVYSCFLACSSERRRSHSEGIQFHRITRRVSCQQARRRLQCRIQNPKTPEDSRVTSLCHAECSAAHQPKQCSGGHNNYHRVT